MKINTFVKLAGTIAARAATYRTKRACVLALARVKAAWLAAGGYGNLADLRQSAIAAVQDRWVELDGNEWDAKMAALRSA